MLPFHFPSSADFPTLSFLQYRFFNATSSTSLYQSPFISIIVKSGRNLTLINLKQKEGVQVHFNHKISAYLLRTYSRHLLYICNTTTYKSIKIKLFSDMGDYLIAMTYLFIRGLLFLPTTINIVMMRQSKNNDKCISLTENMSDEELLQR